MIFDSGKLLINRGDWIRTNDLLLPSNPTVLNLKGKEVKTSWTD